MYRNRFDNRRYRRDASTAFDLKNLRKKDNDVCQDMIDAAEHARNAPFTLVLSPYMQRSNKFILGVNLDGIDNGQDWVDIVDRDLLFDAYWEPEINDVYKAFSKRSLKELQKLGKFDKYYDIFVLEGLLVNDLVDFQEGEYITEFVTAISNGLAS